MGVENKIVITVENIGGRLICHGVKGKKDILSIVRELVPSGSRSDVEFTVDSIKLFDSEKENTENLCSGDKNDGIFISN